MSRLRGRSMKPSTTSRARTGYGHSASRISVTLLGWTRSACDESSERGEPLIGRAKQPIACENLNHRRANAPVLIAPSAAASSTPVLVPSAATSPPRGGAPQSRRLLHPLRCAIDRFAALIPIGTLMRPPHAAAPSADAFQSVRGGSLVTLNPTPVTRTFGGHWQRAPRSSGPAARSTRPSCR